MCGRLDTYITSFSHLKGKKDTRIWTSSSNFRSPLIPLLLLSVIDQIENKTILRNFITPDNNLIQNYNSYLKLLEVDTAFVSIAAPFYELGKTTFWRLLPKAGLEAESNLTTPVTSTEKLMARYHGARLAEDLYTILQMEHLRNKLASILIKTYFNSETTRYIAEQSSINLSII